MFLIRLAILAVFVVVLLPDERPGHSDFANAQTDDARFCDRYPHTCAASGELWSAFKRKAAHGVTLAREALVGPSENYGGASRSGAVDDRKLPERYGAARPTPDHSTLRQNERYTEWRPDQR